MAKPKKTYCQKVSHRSRHQARVAAQAHARQLNRQGELSEDLYAYRCSEHRAWHLTRRSDDGRQQNELIFTAPPEALQRWAMGRPDGEA